MDIFRKELDTYDGHTVTQITLVNDNGVEISCLASFQRSKWCG